MLDDYAGAALLLRFRTYAIVQQIFNNPVDSAPRCTGEITGMHRDEYENSLSEYPGFLRISQNFRGKVFRSTSLRWARQWGVGETRGDRWREKGRRKRVYPPLSTLNI
ncbi:hypothetical protein ACWCWD_27025 [Streptomyces sp. NPDC001493]